MILTAMNNHKTDAGVQENGCGALWNILSTTTQHKRFKSDFVMSTIHQAIIQFPDSQTIKHCEKSLNREENPMVMKAIKEGVCTLVHVQRCHKPCGAEKLCYCSKCCVPQKMFLCLTCHGVKSPNRYCEVCFSRHHSGHQGIEMFIPNSCDCLKTDCRTPMKKQIEKKEIKTLVSQTLQQTQKTLSPKIKK